jgi:hypothetical protein
MSVQIEFEGTMPNKELREDEDTDRDDIPEEANAEGEESEEDLGSVDPSLLGKAVVTGTDWTADTILNQLKKGNITLDPVFQRRDAWTERRKSKFIESIILGLPIPQLVLAESPNAKGTFIVIDGKQRLLSLQQFAGVNLERGRAPLTLKGLLVRTELNGQTYADLESQSEFRRYLTAFENQSIRTVVVRNWQNDKVLYLIFHRLNTTSVPLSPQELRQALHPGNFLRFAAEYSESSPGLRKALNLTKPDFRMRDVELLVRYYAYQNFITEYSGNLKDFLDTTCKRLNQRWSKHQSRIEAQANQFERAISATVKVFGKESSFRKWDGQRFERRFNRAVFDIMVYYFSKKDIRTKALGSKRKVRSAFQALCTDRPEFIKSVETTTKSLQATWIRFSRWGRALRKLGFSVDIPRLRHRSSKN